MPTRGCFYLRISGQRSFPSRHWPHQRVVNFLRAQFFVNSRTNCYFSTEVNQIFYTPPCKRCTDFTETYRIVCRAVLVRARACFVLFLFVEEVHRTTLASRSGQTRLRRFVLDMKWILLNRTESLGRERTPSRVAGQSLCLWIFPSLFVSLFLTTLV